MKPILFFFTITLFFTACNIGESKEELAAKKLQEKRAFEEKIANSKEVQLKKIDAQKEQELAKIESRTTLAKLEKEQLLEKIKLEAQTEKEKLLLAQAKEKEIFDAKLRELEHKDSMEIKRYLLLILFLILVITSYFIYLHFKRKHDDQLRTYQDNLDKYFQQQENMTRMRIAEKIIDTVASGNLEKEHKHELLKALSGNIIQKKESAHNNTEKAKTIEESTHPKISK